MAAPNAQPCGSRPGPKSPNEHSPFSGAVNGEGQTTPHKAVLGESDVATHGTPKPTGNGKSNPLH